MRLSARRTDPDYNYALVKRAIVLLDGVEQRFVISADEEKGEIEIWARDDHGRPVWGPNREKRTEVRTGRVELRFKPIGESA